MSKFTEFYKKAVADEAAKKEMTAILGDKGLNEATDEELAKVSEVAKKLGVDITAEEIKAFASGNAELDDDDLEAAAGGITDSLLAPGGFRLVAPMIRQKPEEQLSEEEREAKRENEELSNKWRYK